MENGTNIWQKFASFQTTSSTQKYLKNIYLKLQIVDSEMKSFDNCYPFIYYIEHGRNYYQLAEKAPVALKPVLLFYGMIQLIKACVLTVDPNYPKNTTVLAHGVSTRKRKKRNYAFLQDEVKLQKKGLLSHLLATIFKLEHPAFDRLKMNHLFARIPELNETFQRLYRKVPMLKVDLTNEGIAIPIIILDYLKMTEQRFKDFLTNRLCAKRHSFHSNDDTIFVSFQQPLTSWDCLPFAYHRQGDFYLPVKKELYDPIHEVVVHYLLLYNLSMVSRYETEWWNDLLHTFANDDFPFIQQFLALTEKKIPHLLYTYLDQKRASQ